MLLQKEFLPFWKHPQLVLEKIKLEYHDQIKDIFFFVLSSIYYQLCLKIDECFIFKIESQMAPILQV